MKEENNIVKTDVEVKDNMKLETAVDNPKKNRKVKMRTLVVIAIIAIFVLGTGIIYRANYIECLEMGTEYVEAFMQNVKYRLYIGTANFIVIFMIVCMTNRSIKKGLKKFFHQDKKEMPKLPNKSLALAIALITSIVVSNMFLQKTILFVNAAQFGISDPMYGMDAGFYMFQAPLIRTAFILWTYNNNNINCLYGCILYYCI